MKKITTEIKWAFIFAGMMLVWMLLEKLAGFHSSRIELHPIVTNFIAIPAIAVYVFALLDKKKRDYSGTMTYMQGLIAGAVITLIVTVLSPLVQIITTYVITPEYFPNVIKYAVASGHSTQQEAEKYFSLGNYVVQGLIGSLVMGLVTAAIVAAFTRTRKAEQIEQR